MKEQYYDKLLHIKTDGNQNFPSDFHYYRYEPTPYNALEQLFEWYELNSNNRLVDFGCGKGRLNFFVHYLFQGSVVGVEMNETFYQSAQENLKNYIRRNRVSKGQIQFYHCFAEDYRVNPSDDRFYFFNPFSVQIFMKVIGNILKSFEKTPRELDLLLYYPSDDYIYFLENETPFELQAEVTLEDLFVNDPYERFLIYRLGV
ncbi:SAM-dependent methyltransferase [Alicyclobacillus fastidiosus]|uniref:SAM-dependent methyltransferase n=1 Tax=Alicyclobacillus fastidiosus TaxID=392011 RepID=A0ABY6ZAZ5_9BACL|nr:methyltransferase [Alicyclobacillus fastidiosus]WAH40007.1 SAM-dependent methyltransferase [Alicyclobacillus fastidiosus]GMA61299.1 methyltransferase [Alicyclobacillus fastidiosus]